MNIVFMGTPLFAKEIMQGLCLKHNILALITQPDKPFGRKKTLKLPETKEYALSQNIPCYQPLKSSEIIELLVMIQTQSIEKKIDAVIVVAYGKILPREIVQNYFCINLHGSVLPYFRGASPVQTSIINNYKHFGLSVIHMDEGLDSGNLLAVQEIDSKPMQNKNIVQVFDSLVPYSIEILEEVLQQLQSSTLKPLTQNHDLATYCPKLGKSDSYLDMLDARRCYLRYLALENIGVWVKYNNEVLKINKILDYKECVSEQKGKILEINKQSVCIACESGVLLLETVTPQNKSKMNITSFLQSKNLKVGDVMPLN